MKPILFLSLWFVIGCVSQQRNYHGSDARSVVFPLGVYRHEISLGLKDGSTKTFNGVVKLSEKEIIVVGLSHFGSTVFRIQENREMQKVQSEVFYAPFKKYEARVTEFYGLIRDLLLLKMGAVDNKNIKILKWSPTGMPLEAELTQFKEPVRVTLSEFDEHQIPAKMEIHQTGFTVTVKVVGYDL